MGRAHGGPVGHAGGVTDGQRVPETEADDRRVRVFFDLDVDEDGWPPVATETMWARPTDEPDLFVLDNIPFFVRGLSDGDVLRAVRDEDGRLVVTEHLASSGNCTIRVIPLSDGPLAGDKQAVLDAFAPLGVEGEGVGQFDLVALNVPPEADLDRVKGLLLRGVEDGSWDYEEGCIGDAWDAAAPR